MKLISLLVAAVALSGLSCERHEFDGPHGTKRLHEHEAPAHGAVDSHGETQPAH